MNARVRLALYRLGATLFFGFAAAAWYFTFKFWRQLHVSSGGIGAISIGFGALLIELLVPLTGNLIIWRPARRSRLATLLRRVHLMTVAATFYAILAGSLLLHGVLAGAQFAVLASAYLVLAVQSPRTDH